MTPASTPRLLLAAFLLAAGCGGSAERGDDALADSLAAALAGRASPPDTAAPGAARADTAGGVAVDTGAAVAVDTSPTAPASPRVCQPPAVAASSGTRVIQVFFSCGEEVQPVRRRVPETPAVLRAALEQLLAGPTVEERRAGFDSFFSDATAGMLGSVVVASDGVARISFRDFSAIIQNASSSAGSRQLIDQLRGTIFQYPSVRAAIIGFDGDCEAFWNWLQRGCQPLRRDGAGQP